MQDNTNTEKRTHTHTHTQKTTMTAEGFKPTITVSKRAKTVHALDRSASVTGQDDGKIQTPSNFLLYTPSSVPFRICLYATRFNFQVLCTFVRLLE
jgi:hypothetical protein